MKLSYSITLNFGFESEFSKHDLSMSQTIHYNRLHGWLHKSLKEWFPSKFDFNYEIVNADYYFEPHDGQVQLLQVAVTSPVIAEQQPIFLKVIHKKSLSAIYHSQFQSITEQEWNELGKH